MSSKRPTKALWWTGGSLMVAVVVTAVFWGLFLSGPNVDAALTSSDPTTMRESLLTLSEEDLSGDAYGGRRQAIIDTAKEMPPDALVAFFTGGELTDEQRETLWKNLRALGEAYMKDVVSGYFALQNNLNATDEEKLAYLDKQIDEWLPFMEKMDQYRRDHKDDPAFKAMEEKERERWKKASTRDARKERLETTDPDQQARTIFYFRKAMERAKERGIEMGPGRRDRQEREQPDKTKEQSSSDQNQSR